MLIFVYGTLLKGLERSYVLEGSDFIGDAVAGGVNLYDLNHFPGIKQGDGAVVGELYYVENEIIQMLDMVEGYNPNDLKKSLYQRSEIKIILPTIATDVFAYFYNLQVDDETLIDDGDYRNFLQPETVS